MATIGSNYVISSLKWVIFIFARQSNSQFNEY